MFYSACCSIPLKIYQEICPKCLRKCEVDIICRKCKGDGQIEQPLYKRWGIKGAEIQVNEIIDCNRCDGFGFIELNL